MCVATTKQSLCHKNKSLFISKLDLSKEFRKSKAAKLYRLCASSGNPQAECGGFSVGKKMKADGLHFFSAQNAIWLCR
jgi:hypothetical protein